MSIVSEQHLKLAKAPIVEAVIDIDCDMPPTLDIKELERPARDLFRDTYPKLRHQVIQEHKIKAKAKGDAPPEVSSRHGIQAFQFLHDDEKQLVQIRRQGFSLNRLAPYTSLDDYLPEIERTWLLFLELALPVQIRAIRLRYINRLSLPRVSGKVELNDYLMMVSPRFPSEGNLRYDGFLNQYAATEEETGNTVNIVLTSQKHEQEILPVIFDITAAKAEIAEPDDWALILSRIQSLRKLKNRIFVDTLTKQCLKLFQ